MNSLFHPSITPLEKEECGPISLQSVDVVVTEFLQNPHQNGGIVIIQDSKLKKKFARKLFCYLENAIWRFLPWYFLDNTSEGSSVESIPLLSKVGWLNHFGHLYQFRCTIRTKLCLDWENRLFLYQKNIIKKWPDRSEPGSAKFICKNSSHWLDHWLASGMSFHKIFSGVL